MLKDVDENMITSGVNLQIDDLNRENKLLLDKLEILKNHILSFFKSDEKSFVTINRLDKEGFYISITKNRYNLVKDELLKSHLIIDDKLLLFKDFSIKTQTNSVKISCDLTDDISDKYVHNLKKIVEINKLVFKEKLIEFEKKVFNTFK